MALAGCPDADGDGGIADKDDECPNEAVPLKTMDVHGLDADGDGVLIKMICAQT
jgi:hypothetical protein